LRAKFFFVGHFITLKGNGSLLRRLDTEFAIHCLKIAFQMLTAAISASQGLTNPISNKAYPFKKLEQHYSIQNMENRN
jgi:hypothetical protein